MQSHYCAKCHKLLLKSDYIHAEIVCHRCKHLNKIKFLTQEYALTKKVRVFKIGVNR